MSLVSFAAAALFLSRLACSVSETPANLCLIFLRKWAILYYIEKKQYNNHTDLHLTTAAATAATAAAAAAASAAAPLAFVLALVLALVLLVGAATTARLFQDESTTNNALALVIGFRRQFQYQTQRFFGVQ